MRRMPGWEQRLTVLLTRAQAVPFAWGQNDCATLALGAVDALTGVNLALGLPKWFSPVSALRTLRAAGAHSAGDFFASRLTEIPVALADRGDLVLPEDPRDLLACPAVLAGVSAHSLNEQGAVVMPRELARRAFRVG